MVKHTMVEPCVSIDTLTQMMDADNPFHHIARGLGVAGEWRIAYCGERFRLRGLTFEKGQPVPAEHGPFCPDCLRIREHGR